MKKILITGANSYIGTNLEEWLNRYNGEYKVSTIDLRDETWRNKDFSLFDVVFHVAGIAHEKETKNNKELYYKINRDLSYETAKKAKKEGVKQFIFLSSMSVYGLENGVIYKDTLPNPKSNYGKSKFQAEELIKTLNDDSFSVAIIRAPMVYGKGCKGNYPKLAKFALRIPFFPDINNKRSMIYIFNLCEFIRLSIDNNSSGIFFPQNSEYVKTSELVSLIAETHGKKIKLIRILNPIIKLLGLLNFKLINKVFGDLVYDMSLSDFVKDYRIYEFRESIFLTEKDVKK